MITFADDGKTINPIEPHEREWALFLIFVLSQFDGDDPEDWDSHIDWVRARFETPDAWLGSEGAHYRKGLDWRDPGREFVRRWQRFKAAHVFESPDEINRLLGIMLFDA